MRFCQRFFSIVAVLLALFVPGSLFAGGEPETTSAQTFSVGVFVPGFVEGSPTYEMLVAGAQRAVDESANATLEVSEAGFNQSEWLQKLTAFAATGAYDVIVTSNPAMPALCAEVAERFPQQRFVVIDGYLEGHPQIHTRLFNQVQQSYFVGYMGGLVTASSMENANPELRVGMVVGQRYPIMDEAIRPGFERGVTAAAAGSEVDFRVVGNWYDAAKAAELATSMYAAGVDVILTIAGGANQGVVRAATEQGGYVLWYDDNGYGVAPGIVVGSGVVAHDRSTYEAVSAAISGALDYGTALVLGAGEGYVGFVTDDPDYRQTVPADIRERMAREVARVVNGEVVLEMPRP